MRNTLGEEGGDVRTKRDWIGLLVVAVVVFGVICPPVRSVLVGAGVFAALMLALAAVTERGRRRKLARERETAEWAAYEERVEDLFQELDQLDPGRLESN